MFSSFFNGLMSGFTKNPVIEYTLISLAVLLIAMKIIKWWGNFKNRL